MSTQPITTIERQGWFGSAKWHYSVDWWHTEEDSVGLGGWCRTKRQAQLFAKQIAGTFQDMFGEWDDE